MDVLNVRARNAAWLASITSALGLIWGHSPAALSFVPGIWGVLWLARTRLLAWVLVGLYHIVAARSLVMGAVHFFELSGVQALALVALGAAVASVPYALVWCPIEHSASVPELVLRVLVATLLSTLPPLGAFSVASPLPAAGIWFPGFGWLGVCGVILFGAWLRHNASRQAVVGRWCLALVLMCVAYGACLVRRSPSAGDVEAVQTAFPSARTDLFDFGHQWQVAQRALALISKTTGKVVVLPEATAGLWQPPMARLWAPLAKTLHTQGRVALVGTTLEQSDGSLQAASVVLGVGVSVYRQRVPVPFAMWRPWSSERQFPSNFGGSGVVHTPLGTLGMLICWEVGSSWAVLQSVAEGAEVLVAMANTAWLRGTNATNTQRQILPAWGALFGLPYVLSVNE